MKKFVAEKIYELVIVFHPRCDQESILNEQLDNLKKTLGTTKGLIIKQDIWGKRHLSYEIRNEKYGYYVVLVIKGTTNTVSTVERSLQINENVLRYLTVEKDQYAPDFNAEILNEDSRSRRRRDDEDLDDDSVML